MTLINAADLASYPGVTADTATLSIVASEANTLVLEEWATPTTPAPRWVRNIALAVALRVLTNPKGLGSWSVSVDDASRTERAGDEGAGTVGYYLTEDEARRLSGQVATHASRVGSIRLGVAGWTYQT
jgi:hypothetical protein